MRERKPNVVPQAFCSNIKSWKFDIVGFQKSLAEIEIQIWYMRTKSIRDQNGVLEFGGFHPTIL